MIPGWCERYIGIPFAEHGRTRAGCDCWGLVRLVMADVYGLGLPDYAEAYTRTDDQAAVSAAVEAGLEDGWQRVPRASEGDLLVLRIAGRPWHCGLMLNETQFLHCPENGLSCIERIDRPLWSRRIEGFYRRSRP